MAHGRIAVKQRNSETPIPAELHVDRVIEMQQWSAATDIYSIGVLILYLIFRNSYSDPEIEILNRDGEVQNERRLDEKDIESDFRQMLTFLSSPDFFLQVWPDLETLRHALEAEKRERPNEGPIEFREFPIDLYIREEDKEQDDSVQAHPPYSSYRPGSEMAPNLLDRTVEVTNIFTQLVPGARRLVASLEFNLSAFVFIMHFAMACLHRQRHLPDDSKQSKNGILPFCESRIDKPIPNGPTSKARERLENEKSGIIGLVEDELFAGFKIKPSEDDPDLKKLIKPFTRESDIRSRKRNFELEQHNQELDMENEKLKGQNEKLDGQNKEALNKLKSYEANWWRRFNSSGVDQQVKQILKGENLSNNDPSS